jgi:hypothetical protein
MPDTKPASHIEPNTLKLLSSDVLKEDAGDLTVTTATESGRRV